MKKYLTFEMPLRTIVLKGQHQNNSNYPDGTMRVYALCPLPTVKLYMIFPSLGRQSTSLSSTNAL